MDSSPGGTAVAEATTATLLAAVRSARADAGVWASAGPVEGGAGVSACAALPDRIAPNAPTTVDARSWRRPIEDHNMPMIILPIGRAGMMRSLFEKTLTSARA